MKRNGIGRAMIAHALVFVLLVHAALAAVGATRAFADDGAGFVPGVICSHALDAGDASTGDDGAAPSHPSGYHCILCPTGAGGAGPATLPVCEPCAPVARVLHVWRAPAPSAAAPAPRPSGWASSWSSRAPPFHA